jgi:hypothetical protein
MYKKYFLDTVNADFGIFAFYGLIFLMLLMLALRYLKVHSIQNSFIIASFFIFYHLVVIFDYSGNFIPYLPDSDQYNYIFTNDFKPTELSKSLIGFYAVSRILRVLLAENILAYVSFQVFLYFISVVIIMKAWELLYKHRYTNTFRQIFLFTALLLPTSILYTVVPLRECFTTFAFAVTLYYLTLLFQKSSIINFGYISGLFMVFFTRMQVAFYFILSFLGIKVAMDKNLWRKTAVIIVGAGLFFGLVFFTNYQLQPKKLEWARNYRVKNYSPSYGLVKWNTYGDMLASAPELTAQFLLSPLPILHDLDPTQFKLALLDALFVFLILAVVIVNLKHVATHNLFWLLLIIFYLILFGIYEFGVLGAVRHRLPMSLMLIAIAADRLATVLTKQLKS